MENLAGKWCNDGIFTQKLHSSKQTQNRVLGESLLESSTCSLIETDYELIMRVKKLNKFMFCIMLVFVNLSFFPMISGLKDK